MSRSTGSRLWIGPVLGMIGIAAVLWLAATGRLGWYIHPRYAAFTVTMCAVAALGLAGAASLLIERTRNGPGREADAGRAGGTVAASVDRHGRPARRARLAEQGGWLLVALACAGLLIAPPATLSTALAQQRQLAEGTSATSLPAAPGGPGTAPAEAAGDGDAADGDAPTVRDWAGMLRQNGGVALEGRRATISGFVLADGTDAGSAAAEFAVARFAVSCCAVDAQPVGVPVALAGWADRYAEGSWVRVAGVFVANPDPTSPNAVVLRPAEITEIDAPEDPYVY
ncbi:TIGR03943 family protein [Leucobacter allii]|uniref:TIGR03943 family protein n=1 Tax=Leucobacter allii TaxID=2932247 RepID=A0ABY4FPH5_9MICO|nr:TIGR03943 family protein [Leucobacter allii]UOQ58190.1 TIGR03943 family protein [Leucobacter allii]